VLFVEARGTAADFAAIANADGVARRSVEIQVDDTFGDGIHDVTRLILSGRIVTEGDLRSAWQIEPGASTLAVERTSRTYLGERGIHIGRKSPDRPQA
jgi:hypothetical protein